MNWLRRVVALLLLWLAGVATWIAIGPAEDGTIKADAAIVLGAAVLENEPSPVFAARIDHAIKLYEQGRVERLIFTGGKSPEDDVSEAEAARRYAVAAGVPESAISLETRSRTTMQNLRFAKPILQETGAESVLIVSDPLHLRRAVAMAKSLGIAAKPSATPITRYQSLSTQVPFLAREVYFIHHFRIIGE